MRKHQNQCNLSGMKKLRTFRAWKEKALRDPAIKRAYESGDDDPFIEVAHQLLTLRKRAKLTQSQLALRVGTTQQVIARIESLDYKGHSLTTLARVAEALNKKLEVRFVPA